MSMLSGWFAKILKKGEGFFTRTISLEIKMGYFICILFGAFLIGLVVGQL